MSLHSFFFFFSQAPLMHDDSLRWALSSLLIKSSPSLSLLAAFEHSRRIVVVVVYSRRVIGSFSSRRSLPEREIQSIIHSFIRRGDSNALVRSRFPPLPFEPHLSTRGLLLCQTMFPFNQFVAAQYRYSKFGRYSAHALSLSLSSSPAL